MASTKFLADDGTVVAAEDDATVSLITDVSMVAENGKTFRLDGQHSLSVDFDGQVPRERICTPWSC